MKKIIFCVSCILLSSSTVNALTFENKTNKRAFIYIDYVSEFITVNNNSVESSSIANTSIKAMEWSIEKSGGKVARCPIEGYLKRADNKTVTLVEDEKKNYICTISNN